MLGDRIDAQAEDHDVAGACVADRDGVQVAGCGIDHGFEAARFSPIARVGRGLFRLGAGVLTVDAAHKAQAIAAHAHDARLMVIGRADPAPCAGDNRWVALGKHRSSRLEKTWSSGGFWPSDHEVVAGYEGETAEVRRVGEPVCARGQKLVAADRHGEGLARGQG